MLLTSQDRQLQQSPAANSGMERAGGPQQSDNLSATGYTNSKHGITIESTASLVQRDTEIQDSQMSEEHMPLTDRSVPTQEEEIYDVSMTLGIPVSNTYARSRDTCYGIYLQCVLGNAWLFLFVYALLLLILVVVYHATTTMDADDASSSGSGNLYSFGRVNTDMDAYIAHEALSASKFHTDPCSLTRTITLYVSTRHRTQIRDHWAELRRMLGDLKARVHLQYDRNAHQHRHHAALCGLKGPLAHTHTSLSEGRYHSKTGQSVYSHIALHDDASVEDERRLQADVEWHARNLTRSSAWLSASVVKPNALRGVVMHEMAISLRSASILMAFMLPVALMCGFRDIKLVAVTTLSIAWAIALSVLSNELLLRDSDSVCFSKTLNVYLSVVASTLIATFLSSKFNQLQLMIGTRRFQDRWKISVDPTFLTVYPHLDLAYNSVYTIGICSVSIGFAGRVCDNVALMSSGETVSLCMMSTLLAMTHIHPALLKLAEHRVLEYDSLNGDDEADEGCDDDSDAAGNGNSDTEDAIGVLGGDPNLVKHTKGNGGGEGEEEEEEQEEAADRGGGKGGEGDSMLPLTMEVGGTRCYHESNGGSSVAETLRVHRCLKMALFVLSFAVCVVMAIVTPSASRSIALRHYILPGTKPGLHISDPLEPEPYRAYQQFLSEFGPGPLYPLQVITSAPHRNRTLLTPMRWEELRSVASMAGTTRPASMQARGSNAAWISTGPPIAIPLKAMQQLEQEQERGKWNNITSSLSRDASSRRPPPPPPPPPPATPVSRPLIPGMPQNQSLALVHYLRTTVLSTDASVAITDIMMAFHGDANAESDPICAAADRWYGRYMQRVRSAAALQRKPLALVHHMRGIPVEAYEMVHRMYLTLFHAKLAIALPLFVVHMCVYKSLCLAIAFYVAYFMSSALSRTIAHLVLERGAMAWLPVTTFSVGAGAGEAAVQWCIPLFADLSVLIVITLYINTHVLNRCKQIIQHGHHASTVPIIRAMGRLTLQLVCIMAVSLVAARQPVMNQLLLHYIIIMLSSFLTVYCGLLPYLDCLSPSVLAWPYGTDVFRQNA